MLIVWTVYASLPAVSHHSDPLASYFWWICFKHSNMQMIVQGTFIAGWCLGVTCCWNKMATDSGYSLWQPEDEKLKCSFSHLSHLAPPTPIWHLQFPETWSHSSDKDPTGSHEHNTHPAVKLPKPGCKRQKMIQNQPHEEYTFLRSWKLFR
jgi:hypothetical protein